MSRKTYTRWTRNETTGEVTKKKVEEKWGHKTPIEEPTNWEFWFGLKDASTKKGHTDNRIRFSMPAGKRQVDASRMAWVMLQMQYNLGEHDIYGYNLKQLK